MSTKVAEISQFILENVNDNPNTIVFLVAKKFGISRQNAHKHVMKEVRSKKLIKVGQTSSTRYYLAAGKHIQFSIKIKPGVREEDAWATYVKPILLKYPKNIYDICDYSFSEIFNNAIDHSEGAVVVSIINVTDKSIEMVIMDDGIGIFQKIKAALKLETAREALLQLSKGKFTTDPEHHTGQGIFFTSRMCDKFMITSVDMHYTFENDEWLLSSEKGRNSAKGTLIGMSINLNSKKTQKEVFDKFANEEMGFHKSIVGVSLSNDPNDPHVSRSQAKRLLVGLEKFKTVVLNFKGVESVGQAFVDEVFRVFQNKYPEIKITYINASKEVDSTIKTGLAESRAILS